jgi:hypothetical protein
VPYRKATALKTLLAPPLTAGMDCKGSFRSSTVNETTAMASQNRWCEVAPMEAFPVSFFNGTKMDKETLLECQEKT